MLTSLCWLPFVAFLAPAGITPPYPSVVLAPLVADTGTAADTEAAPAPVLLTADVVASYVAIEKALKMYWTEHPEQAKAAHDTHVHRYVLFSLGVTTARRKVVDYAFWTQQDTALAALFTKAHVDPSQLGPTELTVSHAIVAAFQFQPMDTATVTGKNIAAVRTHQHELTEEWHSIKSSLNSVKAIQI